VQKGPGVYLCFVTVDVVSGSNCFDAVIQESMGGVTDVMPTE
jgi:hypothetical protein